MEVRQLESEINGMRISVKSLCRIALMAALMMVCQVGLSSLPNIEVVSVITIAGSIVFGWEMLLCTEVFALLEILIWGVGLWNVMYIYIWPILVIATILMKKMLDKHWWIAIPLNTLYGLMFGALCAIPYLIIGGWKMALAWWIQGISFDLIHAAGNCMTAVFLYRPLRDLFCKLSKY